MMVETGAEPPLQTDNCSNCGAGLTGAFCSECGQSRKSLAYPALELLKDISDSALSWDGRLLSTFRNLYTEPGNVARNYVDGRRLKFTPPFRIYVIISLIFFIIIPASGVQVIGIVSPNLTLSSLASSDSDPVETVDELDVSIVIFRPSWADPPPPLSAESIRRYKEQGLTDTIGYRLRLIPKETEDRLSAAAGQALLSMVVFLALINTLLHPKTRLINHAVYSLYFHASYMPLLAVGVLVGVWLHPVSAILSNLSTILFATVMFYLAWAGERRFYQTSRFGASLRLVAGIILYLAAMLAILISIAYLTIR